MIFLITSLLLSASYLCRQKVGATVTTIDCDRRVKEQFLVIDDLFDHPFAVKPNKKMLLICPSIEHSCCSAAEMSQISALRRDAEIAISKYLNKFIENISSIDDLTPEILLNLIPSMRSQEKRPSKCEYTIKEILFKIQILYANIETKAEKLKQNMLNYITGIYCSVCDSQTQKTNFWLSAESDSGDRSKSTGNLFEQSDVLSDADFFKQIGSNDETKDGEDQPNDFYFYKKKSKKCSGSNQGSSKTIARFSYDYRQCIVQFHKWSYYYDFAMLNYLGMKVALFLILSKENSEISESANKILIHAKHPNIPDESCFDQLSYKSCLNICQKNFNGLEISDHLNIIEQSHNLKNIIHNLFASSNFFVNNFSSHRQSMIDIWIKMNNPYYQNSDVKSLGVSNASEGFDDEQICENTIFRAVIVNDVDTVFEREAMFLDLFAVANKGEQILASFLPIFLVLLRYAL